MNQEMTSMNPFERLRSTPSRPPVLAISALSLLGTLAAQDHLPKPAPVPDPVKGPHTISPLSAAERTRLMGKTPRTPHATDTVAQRVLASPRLQVDRVLFDAPGDGSLWAVGRTYKASFGQQGFTYVPFLGSDAPRNFPVQFKLRAVTVGGQPVEFDAQTPAVRRDQRISFERGVVREIYDLALEQVEQTFVVDSALPGDVTLDLEVVTELGEDAARPGVQFRNQFGTVHYGDAFVVDGQRKLPATSSFDGRNLRIHVAAAQRTAGALVIDPILRTESQGYAFISDSSEPDIAYLRADGVYALVWQQNYSQTDTDAYTEMRHPDGSLVANSFEILDATFLVHARPRVAAVTLAHHFLVVMERYEQGRAIVWSRTRASQAPYPVGPGVQVNGANDTGNIYSPDVGGSIVPDGDPTFFVVWSREYSATDHDVLGRAVGTDGLPRGSMVAIENSANTIYGNAHISQMGTTGGWMVAYNFRYSPTDWDVYGASINVDGALRRTGLINNSLRSDVEPRITSPTQDGRYLVTWERQGPSEAVGKITDDWFLTYANVNFTQQFGLGGFWVRPETDGIRFVLLAGAASISVSSYALLGTQFVQVEGPQDLPGVPSFPAITAQRTGGGRFSDYAIAYVDNVPDPNRISVSTFQGVAPVGGLTRRQLGCAGLGIDVGNRQFLGEPLFASLSNAGTDVTGILLGAPTAASTLCGTCRIGVDLNGPLLHFVNTQAASVPVPADPLLIGTRVSVMGYGIGSGPCIGGFRVSDTIDIVIR
jgi:hypothetical protein